MRNVDWPKWNNNNVTDTLLVNRLILGIHPAAVKCPVSASLVGRSSHVKLSVRSIARSILRCWSLSQKKQATISSSGNIKWKALLLWCFEQWITWPPDSQIHSLFSPLGMENSYLSSKHPTLSVNPTRWHCYQSPVSKHYIWAGVSGIVHYCTYP
jgi:hypothetical protein